MTGKHAVFILVGFMGYAVPKQRGRGLLQRMRSRAFIIGDVDREENRVVYVSVDNGMAFQIVKTEVADRLNKTFGSNLYTEKNVLISGTHTHSTPGGTGGTALVDITTLGFVKENWEACVNGIVQSIIRAHKNLQLGRIKINVGQVENANINRSPASYLNNIDRAQYTDNTDHEMTVLRFESFDGKKEIGMVSFYPVHAVSLNNTNLLVAGDNKGYASYLFEKSKNPPGTLPGQGAFVAAFGQSNEGDVSPNLQGPKCIDTGLPCDFATSTCNGRTEKCIAFGPGKTMYESNQIIGTRQFETANDLYNKAEVFINSNGMVNFRHIYVDMQVSNSSSARITLGK
jgi:neutral ceramidase